MVLACAPPNGFGPLGLPDESKLDVSVYGLAPTFRDDGTNHTHDVQAFTARVIAAAAAEHRAKRNTPLFVGLAQEMFMLHADYMDERARALQDKGHLHEHPDAVEATFIYAAASDGRRWRGRHFLTGARAEEPPVLDLIVGRPRRNEGNGIGVAPHLRRLVGISD